MAGDRPGKVDPAVFDAVASAYDEKFTHSRLGEMLRRRVWDEMESHFKTGDHVLELACGTGQDALWLAERGVRVTATDGSTEMVSIAALKVLRAGRDDRVKAKQISLQDIASGRLQDAGPFDGVLSDFGGLNAIGEWRSLARELAALVRPGAIFVFVVMGPFCPWEIAWHLLHGEWRTAVRRFGKTATATVGSKTVTVWYPTPRRLRQAFSPWFHHVKTDSLGLWLPPSHLGHLVERWPRLFQVLNGIDRSTKRLARGWGDHYILVLARKE